MQREIDPFQFSAYVALESLDTFVALFATYIVDLIARFLRRKLAKKHIAARTLMDDRLLL